MTYIVLVNRINGTSLKVPKFEEDMYYMEKDDLFIIPTV